MAAMSMTARRLLVATCLLIARGLLVARRLLNARSGLAAGRWLAASYYWCGATARFATTRLMTMTAVAVASTGASSEERDHSHRRHTESNETLHQEISVRKHMGGANPQRQTSQPSNGGSYSRDAGCRSSDWRRIPHKLLAFLRWKLCDIPRIRRCTGRESQSRFLRSFECDIAVSPLIDLDY
jgi:hypothetical protein